MTRTVFDVPIELINNWEMYCFPAPPHQRRWKHKKNRVPALWDAKSLSI